MLLRLRDISPIGIPALFGLASVGGVAAAVIASVIQVFVYAYSPLLALGWLPIALLIALPIGLVASVLALSAGLGSRALTLRFIRSSRAGAITGGLCAAASGLIVALIMAGPLGGFGPAFWTGVTASAVGGVAVAAWALRCAGADVDE